MYSCPSSRKTHGMGGVLEVYILLLLQKRQEQNGGVKEKNAGKYPAKQAEQSASAETRRSVTACKNSCSYRELVFSMGIGCCYMFF